MSKDKPTEKTDKRDIHSLSKHTRNGLFTQLFDDAYHKRWQVYRMNFVRGLFFGFGSVIGGTLLIAALIWFLSMVGVLVPSLSDFIQDILDALALKRPQ